MCYLINKCLLLPITAPSVMATFSPLTQTHPFSMFYLSANISTEKIRLISALLAIAWPLLTFMIWQDVWSIDFVVVVVSLKYWTNNNFVWFSDLKHLVVTEHKLAWKYFWQSHKFRNNQFWLNKQIHDRRQFTKNNSSNPILDKRSSIQSVGEGVSGHCLIWASGILPLKHKHILGCLATQNFFVKKKTLRRWNHFLKRQWQILFFFTFSNIDQNSSKKI